MTSDTRSVRESPWAAGDSARYVALEQAIPAVRETELDEWQERVDAGGYREIGPFLTHLIVVWATEYTTRQDGPGRTISEPVPGSERAYLVTADAPHQAHNIVVAYLAVQCPGRSFGTRTTDASVCILTQSKER